MQNISLHVLPDVDEVWSVEEFLNKTETSCLSAATELQMKSLMVEEAVEEILQLVRNAANDMQGGPTDEFDYLKQEGMFQKLRELARP